MTGSTSPAPKAVPTWKIFIYFVVGFFALIGVASLFHNPSPASAPPAAPKPAPVAAAQAAPTQDVQTDSTSINDKKPDNTSGGLDYLSLKVASEEQLKSKLTDDQGVRYRNVETRLSTLEGAGIVAFCGEVNSKIPLGGYGGFKRFIASQSTAITEDGMTPEDFEQAWRQFCTGGVKGPTIWY